jgi:hypothetical protein
MVVILLGPESVIGPSLGCIMLPRAMTPTHSKVGFCGRIHLGLLQYSYEVEVEVE